MANKPFNFPPQTLGTVAANIFNPPTGAGGVGITATNQFAIIRHIRIVNRTASPATFSLFKGLTGGSAAGTEIVGSATSVPANSFVDWYGAMRFDVADFLTGFAGTASALTIMVEGELGVA